MNFGDALLHLEAGRRIHRSVWLPSMYVHIVEDAAAARAIVWAPQGSEVVRWAPTSDDLLARDWDVWAYAPSVHCTE